MTPEESFINTIRNTLLEFDCSREPDAATTASELASDANDYLKSTCKVGEPCSLCRHALSLEFDRGFRSGHDLGYEEGEAFARAQHSY